MKVKTEVLKEMVSKAAKCASNNKLIPITGLMKISYESGALQLVTTDANNYLYVNNFCGEGEALNVVIPVDQFSKLISRMTSEYTTLELTNEGTILTVSGNGKYTIGVPLDEEGYPINYPDPTVRVNFEEVGLVNLTMLQLILQVCRPALATTLEVPVYTNYYVGDKIVATDTYKICGIDKNIFGEKKTLISAEFMNLCEVLNCERVLVKLSDKYILFVTDNITIFGRRPEALDEYAIDSISVLLEQNFSNSCSINKQELLSVLDRVSIFVGTYDNKAIRLTFAKDGLIVESKQSDGIEKVHYVDGAKENEFTCMIDVNMFIQQVKAYVGDVIELHYGEDNVIKLVDGTVTQVIALLGE